MKLVIVQLGDIHIKEGNPVLSRVHEIRCGTRAASAYADAYLLAYTGDLVFSGSKHEYDLATAFCDEIRTAFTIDGKPPAEVFIPGNHDLDFGSDNDARPILLDSVAGQMDSLNLDGTVVRQITAAQDHFFDFIEKRNRVVVPQAERLFFQHALLFDEVQLWIKCINTAWMSTLNENPGRLRFPPSLVRGSLSPGDLSIALLHHPYGWLEPNNARQLRMRLEETCDIIITGHEHASGNYRKDLSDGQHLHYVEGAALHDPSIPRNGFNVIEVDFAEKSYSVAECVWDGRTYLSRTPATFPFARNANRVRTEFCNTERFLRKLRDPGTPFRHPVQRELKLRDFFVYPDLTKRTSELRPTSEPGTVFSKRVPEFLLKEDQVVIVGEEGAGKSSLAKITYEDFRNAAGLIPLLVRGPEFDGFSGKDAARTIRKAFVDQYGEGTTTDLSGLILRRRP